MQYAEQNLLLWYLCIHEWEIRTLIVIIREGGYPVSTADYWIPAFRGDDDFCCGKSAAYFNAGNA
jgi:hypothetical protein